MVAVGTKFLAVVFVATLLMAVVAGAALMLDSKPKASTTSINVHNIASAYMFGPMGLEEFGPAQMEAVSMFQLDIEHRHYGRIYARAGEKATYLALNFTIYVDEINATFMTLAVPSIDFVMDATQFGMLEISYYWEPTGFKAEVDRLPESCTLDSKYIICDPEGSSIQYVEFTYPPKYDVCDPASIVVVMSFTASAERTWVIRDSKVYLTNLLVMSDAMAPLMFHGPMVSVHVGEKLMSYDDFWAWVEEIHLFY